jgi:hypothetical protein
MLRRTVLLLLLPGVLAFAQATGPASPLREKPRHQTRPSIDGRVRVLAKALDLSEAQQSAVKTILGQRQHQAWRIRRDPSSSGGARIEKFRALQDSTVEQIRAVLNEEQREQYNPLAARRLPPAPQQRSVEDWLEATTPH